MTVDPLKRTTSRRRRGAWSGLAALGLSLLIATTTAPAYAASATDRLAGASRYQTAIEVAQYGFPAGADTVYLARGDGFADALAAGSLDGGPILLVPPDGSVPPEVTAEIGRLDPSRVIALGGPSAVPDSTLARLSTGRDSQRLAGSSRYETAVAVSSFGFPEGADTLYLARGDDPADALSAGALAASPVLLVPTAGAVPAEVRAEVQRLDPAEVIALGGPAAVSQSVLDALAAGRVQDRLSGASRFETAAAISRRAFPSGSTVALLARSDGYADALAAGTLDTPILLVPPSGAVPSVVLDEIRRLEPYYVIALGGTSAVPASALNAAAAAGATPPSEAPAPPSPGGDPDNPPPPAPEPDDTGGVVGDGGGNAPPPPPYPSDLPPPLPAVSVGEAHGMDVPPAPSGGVMTGLPGAAEDGPSAELDAMPQLPGATPDAGGADGRHRSLLVHAQPTYPVWTWDRLSYQGLPTAVGRLYASFDGVNWQGACTATAIGRDQILTAAHCFYTLAGDPIPYFRFYPDLYGDQARYGFWSGTINSAFVDANYRSKGNTWYADYGVLKLAPNASGQSVGAVVGAFPVYLDGDRFTANRFTIGYPSEGVYSAANRATSQVHGNCQNSSCLPYYCWSPVGGSYVWESTGYYKSVGFGCYLNGGWSGGPIFQYSNGRYYLVSVTSTMGNPVAYGCSNPVRCVWYGRNHWGPTFRAATFNDLWRAAQ